MQYVLWVLCCLLAYIGGLVIIARVTPGLLVRQFDEGWFMGIAALDILGALLAFGAIFVLFALFNGALGIRILNVFLLIGLGLIAGRMSLYCFRGTKRAKFVRSSRIIAGAFCAFLVFSAIFYMIQLFAAK
ncbi:MAG TPA: hypothetical protein VGN34_09940 [Ktedonobacteraceae bacterium]|jgi:hypothetical protein